jgi:hypothetical protein
MLSIIFKPLNMPTVAKIVVAQALRKSPNMEPDNKIGQLNHRNIFMCRTSLLDEQVYTRRIYGKHSYCFLWLDLVPRAWASPISLLLEHVSFQISSVKAASQRANHLKYTSCATHPSMQKCTVRALAMYRAGGWLV